MDRGDRGRRGDEGWVPRFCLVAVWCGPAAVGRGLVGDRVRAAWVATVEVVTDRFAWSYRWNR